MNTAKETAAELRKIPWFREITPEHFQTIAAITHLRGVRAGEVLFRQGDKANEIYIVIEGRVALDMLVPHRGKIRFYTAEPWEVFGWSSATPIIHQRTAGATAVIDGLIACINAEKLHQACDDDHDLGYLVMRRLANIVASRLLVTRLQLIDMFANPESQNAK
ncbi:MAG: Crp/Fnr family transcriptional regulator [Chloroflexi bacterium]|nr:Crp/Fnr family transcriptional regulator [Chloroflexota bacterium]MBI2759472.1 Crp/Fnr family transcriptional regulator [Chloroflexota bacterium]